jgi:protein lifeguard
MDQSYYTRNYGAMSSGGLGTSVKPSTPLGDRAVGSAPPYSPLDTLDGEISLKSPASRTAFLLKVYSIVLAQLVFSFFCFAVVSFVPSLRYAAQHSLVLSLICCFTSLGLLVPIYCFRRIFPLNLVMLALFTLTFSLANATMLTYFNCSDVIVAIGVTALAVVILSGSVVITKTDFGRSGWIGLGLSVGLFALFSGSILSFFVLIFFPQYFSIWRLVLSVFGAMLFSMYIVYDTSNIMNRFETTEYVAAAITLYLDVMNLFIYVL